MSDESSKKLLFHFHQKPLIYFHKELDKLLNVFDFYESKKRMKEYDIKMDLLFENIISKLNEIGIDYNKENIATGDVPDGAGSKTD